MQAHIVLNNEKIFVESIELNSGYVRFNNGTRRKIGFKNPRAKRELCVKVDLVKKAIRYTNGKLVETIEDLRKLCPEYVEPKKPEVKMPPSPIKFVSGLPIDIPSVNPDGLDIKGFKYYVKNFRKFMRDLEVGQTVAIPYRDQESFEYVRANAYALATKIRNEGEREGYRIQSKKCEREMIYYIQRIA